MEGQILKESVPGRKKNVTPGEQTTFRDVPGGKPKVYRESVSPKRPLRQGNERAINNSSDASIS